MSRWQCLDMMSFAHLFTSSVINQPTRSTTLTGRPHDIYIPAPISSLFSQQHSYIFNSFHLNPKQTTQFNMSDFGRQSLGDSESGFSSSSSSHLHPSSFPSLFVVNACAFVTSLPPPACPILHAQPFLLPASPYTPYEPSLT